MSDLLADDDTTLDAAIEVVRSVDRLPSRLSPSRAKDFVQCPRLFFYKSILRHPTPSTLATAKGTIAHTAFERLFDHERAARTPETALAYVAPAWRVMIDPYVERDLVSPDSPEWRIREASHAWVEDLTPGSLESEQRRALAVDYRILAPPDSEAEAGLIAAAEAAVANYFTIERPWNFDPVARELHLEADAIGVTLHGFIDRLDRYTTSAGEERWVISDYKTGRVPNPRFLDDAFFGLKVYAVLFVATHHVLPHSLRLVYVTANREEAVKVLPVDQTLIDATQQKMRGIWRAIQQAARREEWTPKKGPLCNWCHFQDVCPAWNPGIDGIVAGSESGPTPGRH